MKDSVFGSVRTRASGESFVIHFFRDFVNIASETSILIPVLIILFQISGSLYEIKVFTEVWYHTFCTKPMFHNQWYPRSQESILQRHRVYHWYDSGLKRSMNITINIFRSPNLIYAIFFKNGLLKLETFYIDEFVYVLAHLKTFDLYEWHWLIVLYVF